MQVTPKAGVDSLCGIRFRRYAINITSWELFYIVKLNILRCHEQNLIEDNEIHFISLSSYNTVTARKKNKELYLPICYIK